MTDMTDLGEGELVNLPARTITREEARRRTDEFKVHTEVWLRELVALHDDEVWWALGYYDWDEYCKAEFGSIRLPRGPGRTEAVRTLIDADLSIRAISSALGLGYGTVQREIKASDPNGSPTPENRPETAVEPASEVDESEAEVAHQQWLSEVVAKQRLARAKYEARSDEDKKHEESCEKCRPTPQKQLLYAVFEAVLLDGMTDLDQIAANNRLDPDIAALAWAKCWRMTGEGVCVRCRHQCHSPAPDLDFHLAANPCRPKVDQFGADE